MGKVHSIGKTEVKTSNPNKMAKRLGKLMGSMQAEQKAAKKAPPPAGK